MKEFVAIAVFPLTVLVLGIALICWIIGGLEDWYRSRFD